MGTAHQEIPVAKQALSFTQEEIDFLEFALWEAKRKHRDDQALQQLWLKVRRQISDEHDLMTGPCW
jgi:hypothetical protein